MAGNAYKKADEVRIDGNRIFSPVRKKWLPLTPEEQVRQQYLAVLLDEYGYSLEHIDEEMSVTGRGSAQARADFIVWRTAKSRRSKTSRMRMLRTEKSRNCIPSFAYSRKKSSPTCCTSVTT